MISITGATGNYILQPGLIDMHRKSVQWLSAAMLWKREVIFFQKLLDQYAPAFTELKDKKSVDHFQSLITYYSGELIDHLRKKLREHEGRLARLLQEKNESDVQYFSEHQELMGELNAFSERFVEFKHEFFDFVEGAM